MDLQSLLIKLRNTITRAVTDRRDSTGRYQVQWGGDRASSGVEHIQPQGVHFSVPSEADAILVSPGGDRSAGVIVAASGATPADSLPPGTGGLHYLGEWRVFVSDDGSVHLGAREPSDFVALASKVDAEVARLDAAVTAIKSLLAGPSVPPVGPPPPGVWVPVPMDGGLALQVAAGAALADIPGAAAPTGSEIVRAE
jgi:phage gp45-like